MNSKENSDLNCLLLQQISMLMCHTISFLYVQKLDVHNEFIVMSVF